MTTYPTPRVRPVIVRAHELPAFAARCNMSVDALLAFYRQHGGQINAAGELLWRCEEADA